MRKLLYSLISVLLVATLVYASGALQTINTMPTSGANFLPQLQTFLREEDAERYQLMFRSFVVSGGIHGTGTGLTFAPTSLTAFANGFYVTEVGSITYTNNSICYVIADANLTGNLTTFVRVAGTHYLIDCATTPTTPATAVSLMTVTTSGGSVTVVVDTRPLTVIGPLQGGLGFNSYAVGDLFFANTTTTIAKLADVVDGNVLRSGGVNVAPLYGKVRLSGSPTDITGTLAHGNGGSGLSATPTSGQLLIGNGTGFTLAGLTAGTGISITPGAGSITVTSLATTTGLFQIIGLRALNNSVTPNTQYDLVSDYVQLKNPSDNTIVVRNAPSTVTIDVAAAGPVVNGRDQAGAFSADSWVYFYYIWNGTTLAGISSATAPTTGPTLPGGYTHWTYAGVVRFNASSQLVRTRIRGSKAFYETRQSALAAGVATVETAVSLSSFVPPAASDVMALFRIATSVGTQDLTLRVVTGSDFFVVDVSGATQAHAGQLTFPNILQQIFYLFGAAPAAGLDLHILGYGIPNGAT